MKTSKSVRRFPLILSCSLLATISYADPLVSLDFETGGQYAANFRRLTGNGVATESDGSVGVSKGGSNPTALAPVYDTTPANGDAKTIFTVAPGTTLTISCDVKFATANASFGIYLVNPAAENSATALLGLVNPNFSGENDQIRFSRTGNPGNQVGAGTLTAGSYANDADLGIGIDGLFHTITLEYSIDENSRPVLALTVGNTTSTKVYTDVTALTDVEVAFRISPQGTAGEPDIWFDNFIVSTTTAGDVPATVVAQPGDVWAYEGNSVAIDTATFAGTPPLFYQWYFEGAPLSGETNPSLNLANAASAMEGNYSVTVWNDYGTNQSGNARLTVIPQDNTPRLASLWNLLPGDREYITTSTGGQRGMAYDSVNNDLLLVSHNPTNCIVVLDPVTGAEKGFMNVDGIPAGAAGINVIGVAEDGVVYAGNVTANAGSASTPFILWRWDSDDAASIPVQVLSGDPGYYATETGGVGRRWGDNLAVRGTGSTTQILLGPGLRNNEGTTNVCFLVTQDGYSFTPVMIPVPGVPAGFAQWGVAFGPGDNTFWAKSSGQLYLVEFDLNAQTASVLESFSDVPDSWKLISTDSSKRWLAGVWRVGHNLPDNVRLYDVSDLDNGPMLADQELYTTAVLNGVEFGIGAGATAFGGDHLFALSEGNGIKAFTISSGLVPFPLTITRMGNGDLRLSWPTEPGQSYQVQSRTSLTEGEWINVGAPIEGAGAAFEWTTSGTGTTQFYRVEAQ